MYFGLQAGQPQFYEEPMQACVAIPSVPVGKIKAFGPFGEQYEVIQPLRASSSGYWWVEIELVKTGEKADYHLSHINEGQDGILFTQ